MDDVTSRSSPELDPLLAPPTRSRKGAVLVGVLLLALVLVWFWARGSAEPNAVAYQEVAVERGDIEASVTATGTLSALVTVDVGSQISGRIQALYADFNSRVEAGQRIAKIDPALFEAAVERAQANVAAAEASIKRAEVQATDARRQAERTETLITRGLIARSERDTAATAAATAEADLTAARASALQARASLREARANLEYTDILSPTEGVVISRSVNVGQTVAASLQAPVLFTIAQDLRQMQVNTSVAEADIGRLRDGMAVYFTVDAYPGERFEGQVRQIRNAATVNLNVVTYDAVIDVDNPALKLKPGMEQAAAFLEPRRYAAMLGATTEFNKMEGVAADDRKKNLYVAMSYIEKGMTKDETGPRDDIQVAKLKAAAAALAALLDAETSIVEKPDAVDAARIKGVAIRTPLLNFPVLDERLGARVFLKAETLQRTGSFKFRGAYNKISSIPADKKHGGVVAYSSGNHAQGVAHAAALCGVRSVIVMPSDAPKAKRERTKAFGAEVVLYDRDREDRAAIARRVSEERGAILVPPFDDPLIIAGQGTAGREICEDLGALGVKPDMAVIGASGRMGSQACQAVEAADGLELVGRFDDGDDLGAVQPAHSSSSCPKGSGPSPGSQLCPGTPQPSALTALRAFFSISCEETPSRSVSEIAPSISMNSNTPDRPR